MRAFPSIFYHPFGAQANAFWRLNAWIQRARGDRFWSQSNPTGNHMWSIVRDHQPSGDVGDVDDPRITCSVTRFFGRVNLKLQILLFFFFSLSHFRYFLGSFLFVLTVVSVPS